MTDTGSHDGVLEKLERYLDVAPRAVAVSRECGPFTVFVRDNPRGHPLYARPRLGYAHPISTVEVRRMLDFQRAIGVPRALEWVHETTPTLLSSAREAGMGVQECALLRLADYAPAAAPTGYRVHEMKADDPQTGAVLAAIDASFRDSDQIGPPDSSLQKPRMRSRLLVLVGAFDTLGRPVGGGMHNPRGDLSEVTGIGTLPSHRGRGIGTAITSALTGTALREGHAPFLSAATQSAVSVYESVGYTRVGTACVAAGNERG
ncbi:GNAT family N-acetyltransferase [Allobranchiibius sp. CTAmp26]|uniref:GNAT family N-acetyltransferase n=1 Tax=Allobranchiibius sp. CTAmp26 TaxID=2815214 RepID=UPI001AA0CEC4|nr:GNAT family N-acetyltransferase [Allobranchiibius sp. CTAmp26]MBO1753581.1 GNAT family N-acetyltransferase [Allobranchiibius sp. CTAmp26]